MMDEQCSTQWALEYILDPLTGPPEPSQETGPASSHARTAAFIPQSLPLTPPPRHTSAVLGSPAYTSFPATPGHLLPYCRHHRTASDIDDRCPASLDTYPDLATSPPDYWSFDFFNSGSASNMASHVARRESLLLGRHHVDHDSVTSSPRSQRSRSLSPNFNNPLATSSSSHPSNLPLSRNSGDMSDRPLDKIRAAERRHKQRKPTTYTDIIDRLDTTGGPYHHGGPFDATLPCRNLDKMYSPLAAVRESNMEAIRATPRENLVDSLIWNVPIQGTASVPPGAMDLSGNVMDYAEGADLMREADAPGGAYKRWAGIPYHPEDLKGKGEPSFTLDRDLKSKKRRRHSSMPGGAFEMLGITARQRPASVTPGSVTANDVFAGDLQRSNSTSKKLEGIKRRLGSFRRKKPMAAGEAH
ncbi:protein kinase [Ophiocordyceps sinensis CO18]|uniref:Protein kinase n=1 Tax=Ophiocordyceps sinensis (strain Co18 / CGMCC 3.14243) TaxID=911162 RepID=T5ADK5_OPHSC|nr:protein kinase [Ophiocordyceps sinensis CO18]